MLQNCGSDAAHGCGSDNAKPKTQRSKQNEAQCCLNRDNASKTRKALPKTQIYEQNEAREENLKEHTRKYVTESCRSATKLCVAYMRFNF